MKLALGATQALMGAAVATAATLSATVAISPVQAAQLAPGSTLNLSQSGLGGGVNISSSRLNFFGPYGFGSEFNSPGLFGINTDASTGSFGGYRAGAGLIKDLTLPPSGPTASQKSGFLKFVAVGTSANPFAFLNGSFNLNTFTVTSTGNQPFSASLNGFFNVSGFSQTFGIGTLTAQAKSGKTKYVINITAVPTPALLPGLIGFGVAALRKRKSEASAQAETQV